MSLHNLKANLDRYTHVEAQEWQKAQMAARAEMIEKRVAPCAAGDKKSLHRASLTFRGPDDEGIDSGRWLSAMAAEHGVGPSDREIAEYEDFYLRKFKVREDDEVRRRKVKIYARDRWTIDTIALDAGITLPGVPLSKTGLMPTVQKAFTTSTTQVIFPFYYAAAIQAGIIQMPIVDRLIMEDVPVNSHTVDHAMMTDNLGDRTTSVSGEGASGTEVVIRADKHPITLTKYKSRALASYEAIRLQRLPIFERGLMRVGQQFMVQITDAGMDVAVSGDGTTIAPGNGAAPIYDAKAHGAPNYLDIINLDTTFPQGYEVEEGIWVAAVAPLMNILNMPEFKDPLAGWHYQNDGAYPTPVGKEMYRWDSSGKVSGWLATSCMQVKTGIALVKYTEGGLLVETDRIIDGQWEQAVTSTWTGFAVWDRKAVVVGTNFS